MTSADVADWVIETNGAFIRSGRDTADYPVHGTGIHSRGHSFEMQQIDAHSEFSGCTCERDG